MLSTYLSPCLGVSLSDKGFMSGLCLTESQDFNKFKELVVIWLYVCLARKCPSGDSILSRTCFHCIPPSWACGESRHIISIHLLFWGRCQHLPKILTINGQPDLDQLSIDLHRLWSLSSCAQIFIDLIRNHFCKPANQCCAENPGLKTKCMSLEF